MPKPPDSAGATPAPGSTAFELPARADGARYIGKYQIQKKLGAGGMGAVYLALDPGLKRSIALKVLPKDKAGNPTLVKRFKAEAQAAANLRHENIVTVFEAGEADGFLFMALEYVDGTDVANLVAKRGPMPVKRSVEIVRQVALALQHAYEQQVVHRDIKPSNLLVRRDGAVKLADLGLARVVDDNDDTSITRAGTTVGTVDYMAPEQARDSKAADVRSDLYSLGCTWFFMLTGAPPFAEGSLTSKLRSHAEAPLPDPRRENPAVSEAVYAVMRRMTAKDPAQRYQTPKELIEDLDTTNFTDNLVSQAILEELEETAPQPRRRAAKTDDDKAGPAGDRGARRKPAIADEPDESPRRRRRPPRQDDDAETGSEWGRAILFYGIVALLVAAVVGGIAALVSQYGSTIEMSGERRKPGENAGQGPAQDVTVVAPGEASGGQRGTTGGDDPGNSPDSNTIRIGHDGKPAEQTAVASRQTDHQPLVTRIGQSSNGSTSTDLSPGAAHSRQQREESQLPAWAVAVPSNTGLPTLVVRRQKAASGEFASLDAALLQAPATGAVIVLEGPGPFPLTASRVENKTRLIIQSSTAAPRQALPLIVLTPDSRGDVLACVNTSLELQGVHLALDAASGQAQTVLTLVRVDGGSLFVRDCSLSVRGDAGRRHVAFAVGGKAPGDSTAQILIDRGLIRGNNLTALELAAAPADVVVRRSIVWSGSAPALQLPGVRSNATGRRALRFVSSTVCSRDCAVQVAGDRSSQPPTVFHWLDALVASDAAGRSALVGFDGWNQGQALQSLGTTFAWRSTATLYQGLKPLVRLEPGNVALAQTVSEWNTLWKSADAGDSDSFQNETWPAEPTGPDVLAMPLARLEPASIGKQHVQTAEGGWPGCGPELLVAPNLSALDAVLGGGERAALPAGIFDAPAGETVRIELDRNADLGKILALRGLQSGMQIVVSGAGMRASSPIVIKNVNVRMRFEQGDGPPLVLTPGGGDKSGDTRQSEAFIDVSNGGLVLEGAAISTSGTARIPKWFIRAVDADLGLRRCRLQGPLAGTLRNEGLVRWERRDGATPARTSLGAAPAYLACEESFLFGSGTLIDADPQQRALSIRNSVLVSREDVLSLNLAGAGPEIGGTVDLENCTLSAAGNFFRVTAAPLTMPARMPLAVFVDRCVYAPPLKSGQESGPTLLRHKGALFDTRQLAWWENRCGYASDVFCFSRGENDPAPASPQDFASGWRARWPKGQVIEPLTGNRGVVLAAPLPQRADERQKVEPASFLLHPQCQAATWDGGQRPIGAPLATMNVPPLRPVPAGDKSKRGKTAPQPQQRPIGF